ncbi:SDR family oxidoreductase [Lacisediminimonas profundi]|uniref:SDR family oxidoreductase n=1 Tax=Lacisediminimonas profundi TaxID=2603856 RepID=UPI003BA93F92
MMPATSFTLVTGATKGIGRAITEKLLAQGENVVGIARRADPGFPAPLLLADLADHAARKQVLAQAMASYPVLRLVNNAGFNRMQPLGEITADAYDEVLNLNLGVTIDATQAVLPAMRAAGFGRIVNISSRSLLGRMGGSMYSAAKAGLVGLTRSWALELAAQGITVNCVAPGPVATEMFAHNNPPHLPRTQAMLAAIPMARMGTPEEIAGAVGYFLSAGASFTTGQTLFVCGGASISQSQY